MTDLTPNPEAEPVAKTCPKGHPLERRPGMFYWRGRDFHGLVCDACKSLWDDPSDSFEEHVGIKKTAGSAPGKDK